MKTVNAAAVASYKSGSGDMKLLLTEQSVGARHGLMGHGRLEPGASIPLAGDTSAHPVEEFDYILSGKITIWVEGEERDLGPGEAIYVDAGQRHVFRNTTTEPAEFVWFLSPGMKL